VAYRNETFKKMTKFNLVLWFSILIVWQLWIIYSIVENLNGNRGEKDINYYVYQLFIEGGWYNFQRWIGYYAQDIFEDILFLGFVFIIPIGTFDKFGGLRKFEFIFVKIGLFLLFTYFILGPPQYNIKRQDLTFSNYFNRILKLKGNTDKGYGSYIFNNKAKLIKIIMAFVIMYLTLRS